jgi:hypothetical protein
MGDPHRLTETRQAELRPLTPGVLTEFIAVEHPSAYIDGAYARVIATLSQGEYPPYMVELALRIAGDGVQHENRFREIRNALSSFVIKGQYPKFLRPIVGRTGLQGTSMDFFCQVAHSRRRPARVNQLKNRSNNPRYDFMDRLPRRGRSSVPPRPLG